MAWSTIAHDSFAVHVTIGLRILLIMLSTWLASSERREAPGQFFSTARTLTNPLSAQAFPVAQRPGEWSPPPMICCQTPAISGCAPLLAAGLQASIDLYKCSCLTVSRSRVRLLAAAPEYAMNGKTIYCATSQKVSHTLVDGAVQIIEAC